MRRIVEWMQEKELEERSESGSKMEDVEMAG